MPRLHKQSAVSTQHSAPVRYWCERLNCGHIVAVLTDGTMLLCTQKYGHAEPCSFTGTIIISHHGGTEARRNSIQVSCGTEPAVGNKVGLGEGQASILTDQSGHKSGTSSRSETQQNRAGLGAEWGIPPAGICSARPGCAPGAAVSGAFAIAAGANPTSGVRE